MRLYLARHGKAEYGGNDEDRRLSTRGRADVEAMAAHLAAQQIPLTRIVHSTLARARETAEIMGAAMAPKVKLEEISGIEPWGDVGAFINQANNWDKNTLVVGHEPFMGEAASKLMSGDIHGELVQVKTGTVMAFSRNPYGDTWQMRWMLNPRLVRGPKRMED
ncbi:phosphohistidine phosphatase SixA [Pseudomonadota bacterium]